MKRISGIVLLVLAALVAVNVARKLSQPSGYPQTASSAYNSGHTAGMVTAPALLGIVGLWLVLTSRKGEGGSPFPVKRVLQGLGILVALLMVAVVGLYLFGAQRAKMRRAETLRVWTPADGRAIDGPCHSGDLVQANWGGKWTPGKITRVNPGGFTLMVQLEDSRYPEPIVLSTNQIRLP